MTEALALAGLLASLLLSFVSSGMETSLYRVSRVRMRIRSDQGDRRAARVLSVLDNLDGMVTTILIDNNIAAYAGTFFLSMQMAEWKIPHAELVTTGIVTPLFFVLTESLPKQLAYSRADYLAVELVRVFSAFKIILSPMVWVLNRSSAALRLLLGAEGEAGISQSQRSLLIEHLNAGVAEHVLSPEQNSMAARIMQLEGVRVTENMIPVAAIVRLAKTAGRARALETLAERRASIALLADSAGRPTDMAVAANALITTPGDPGDPLDAVAERLPAISARAAISDVLALFRKSHSRHALVMDGNRIVGMVTTRTVLDQVAGIRRLARGDASPTRML